MFKKSLFTLIGIALVIGTGLYGTKSWLLSLIPDKAHFAALKQTQSADLEYIDPAGIEYRGKILAGLTSTATMGDGKATGYEHTELARAYWVFTANGFDVDFASPEGGKPPVVIDGEDMGAFDYAFLNDQDIQARVSNSLALDDINPLDYQAVYFVGGKGTMFDFPSHPAIQHIVKMLHQNNRVVSAVCHGPAALVDVRLDNGELLLANKTVSAFTNEEELFLIPDARDVFPFLLEDKLIEQGANFVPGARYMQQISRDGKLITGQNPWSVWALAEAVVEELGYTPKTRLLTPEEHSIALLMTYQQQGFDAARQALRQQPEAYQRILVLMHGILALMEWEFGRAIDIIRLTREIRNLTQAS